MKTKKDHWIRTEIEWASNKERNNFYKACGLIVIWCFMVIVIFYVLVKYCAN